jgi:DNA polymerase-3 subunit delta
MAGQPEIDALVKQLKDGKAKPLVLVYGDQEYLVRQAYDRALEAAVPEDLRDFNLEQHDGSRADPQALLDSLATPPMLAGAKAVGVYDARYFQSKANVGEILEKAREKWQAGDAPGALRQLGRALALAEWDKDEAAQAGPDVWEEKLELSAAEAAVLKGGWLADALKQAEGLSLPAAGDDAGALAEGLGALLPQWIPGTTLVCACSSADARKKLFKLFQEQGQVLDFKKGEKPAQVVLAARPFLRLALDQRGVKMGNALAERLLAAYGHDLGLMELEVEKMAAHAYPRTDLSEDDLLAVGSPRPEEAVFALIDLLGKRELGPALRLLRRLNAEDGNARYQLLGMLISELRLLLRLRAMIDEGKLPARGSGDGNGFRMQVHPRLAKELPPALGAWWKRTNAWRLFFAAQRARAFNGPQLRALLQALAEGDLRSKTGGARPEQVLEEVCARFCGVAEEALL